MLSAYGMNNPLSSDEVRGEFKKMQRSIDLIAQQVNHNTVDISSLKKDVTEIKRDVTDLKRDVTEIKASVDTISGSVILIENQMSDLVAVIREGLTVEVKLHKKRLDHHA